MLGKINFHRRSKKHKTNEIKYIYISVISLIKTKLKIDKSKLTLAQSQRNMQKMKFFSALQTYHHSDPSWWNICPWQTDTFQTICSLCLKDSLFRYNHGNVSLKRKRKSIKKYTRFWKIHFRTSQFNNRNLSHDSILQSHQTRVDQEYLFVFH